MKRKNIYTSLIMAFAFFVSIEAAKAQVDYMSQISVENLSVTKRSGVTSIGMDINLNNLKLNKNELLIITPVVVAVENEDKIELEPIAVKGTLRNKVLQRPFEWKGKTRLTMPQTNQVVRQNGTKQMLHYSTTLPFDEWQRQAKLILKTSVIGCAECTRMQSDNNVSDKILPDKFIPDYRMSYIVPEVEPVKQRSERYSAHLNYVVGRYDLLPNFENNAAELAKVDKIIKELKSDKDLTITDFTISGYASPEDTEERNMLLSQRRAETFAQYLEKKYGYTRNQFKVEWFGEDWKGLREAVIASDLPNKNAVVEIIDNEPGLDARDTRLKNLDEGRTYDRLLNEFYPSLRRNDYDIAFVSRAFNVEEAKKILKTRPKLLSLNEMFLVANTYPENSPQYKEVFDIAADTFPESEVANLNAAVGELEKNNPDAALKRLQKIQKSDKAMALMAIAYALKNDEVHAKDFFNKAVQKGVADAAYNLDQYQQYLNDNM